MGFWDRLKHFTPDEFDCPGVEGSGRANMDVGFIAKLEAAREAAGIPFTITSGYRTVEHDRKVCRAANKPVIAVNSHVSGHAADILCTSARDRFKIVKGAMAAGINRILWDNSHVHLDDDPRLDADILANE